MGMMEIVDDAYVVEPVPAGEVCSEFRFFKCRSPAAAGLLVPIGDRKYVSAMWTNNSTTRVCYQFSYTTS